MARTGRPGQGGQDRAARTGQPGQGSQDRAARTGLPEWVGQHRTARIRQGRTERKDSQKRTDRTARTGLPRRHSNAGLPGHDYSRLWILTSSIMRQREEKAGIHAFFLSIPRFRFLSRSFFFVRPRSFLVPRLRAPNREIYLYGSEYDLRCRPSLFSK
jgi:hypothetical protein